MWNVLVVGMRILDQCMFLGNCPTPLQTYSILLQAWSVNVRFGEGRWAVSQKHTLIQNILNDIWLLVLFISNNK